MALLELIDSRWKQLEAEEDGEDRDIVFSVPMVARKETPPSITGQERCSVSD